MESDVRAKPGILRKSSDPSARRDVHIKFANGINFSKDTLGKLKESCIAVDEHLYHKVPKADVERKQVKAYYKLGVKQRLCELTAHAFGTIA